MATTKDKIEGWKATAELFLKKDIKVYIRDFSDDIYFADIVIVGEETITIQCFAPGHRSGRTFVIYWSLIDKFEKYEVRE